jgi:hypothetical protein
MRVDRVAGVMGRLVWIGLFALGVGAVFRVLSTSEAAAKLRTERATCLGEHGVFYREVGGHRVLCFNPM